MSKNQYKQATKYFGIPVPGWDDGIWPEVEMLKWQMVENMLMAAMRGNVNAVFREGDLRMQQEKDGTYTVRLSATGNEPSVQGAVGGAFFDAPSSIAWKGLPVGKSYYLYVKGSSNTFQDPSDIVPVASANRLTTKFATLIAVVDLVADKPTVDRNPPGKVNARDLAQHVLDYDNPHGDKVIQDEILIRNHLAIGDGNDADLEFDVNGKVFHVPVSRLVESLTTTRTFVDFVSGGMSGVTLQATGKVVFASVTRTNPMDLGAGEVIVGFYGSHPDVKAPNQIIVWNTGMGNVSMRAMIICE